MEKTSMIQSSNWKRSSYCGELRPHHVDQEVTLCGWVHKQRDIGNLVFVDLRDREGLVQVVFRAGQASLLEEAKKVRPETVIGIKGVVRKREAGAVNPQLVTGEIEVEAADLKIFSISKVPPFAINDPVQAAEELRFKYRYLDLRRPSMQRHLKLRHEAALCVRNFFGRNGFYEIETPFLGKSTPEGARDYLVPSRIYKGRFYALPQSPQLYKQTLMIAGFDRYFQIVRCFRDEDLRADRQPEFTQIDVEMSFIERQDLFEIIEALMVALFELIGKKIPRPFPRLSFKESLEKYGTDKPDLRLGLEIRDLSEIGAGLGSELIRTKLSGRGVLKGLFVPDAVGLSRSRLEKINDRAKALGAGGIFWLKKEGEFKSSLKLEEKDSESLWEALAGKEGGVGLLVAGPEEKTLKVLGEIRKDFVQERAKGQEIYNFSWVTDFPLFEWSEDEGRLVSMHHPFTSPVNEDIPLLDSHPEKIRARAYDLVLNGFEVGGGSIRIHDMGLQKKIFKVLGLTPKETEDKFGYFLEALTYGAPPHGGIALGFDRLIMILAGEESIREVIAFPKTTSGLCLFTGSPSEVNEKQLDELGLKLK